MTDTVEAGVEPVNIERMTERAILSRAYREVNDTWGSTPRPPMTRIEAERAARKLYRFVFKKPFKGEVQSRVYGNVHSKLSFHRLVVNAGQGWHNFVHSLSHSFNFRLHPGEPGHDTSHPALEKRMAEYVVKHGWLEGKLKPKIKPPKERNIRAERQGRVLRRLKRWELKRKRAESAIKRLKKQARYYAKTLAA